MSTSVIITAGMAKTLLNGLMLYMEKRRVGDFFVSDEVAHHNDE